MDLFSDILPEALTDDDHDILMNMDGFLHTHSHNRVFGVVRRFDVKANLGTHVHEPR
jgi:hypothetical protein